MKILNHFLKEEINKLIHLLNKIYSIEHIDELKDILASILETNIIYKFHSQDYDLQFTQLKTFIDYIIFFDFKGKNIIKDINKLNHKLFPDKKLIISSSNPKKSKDL